MLPLSCMAGHQPLHILLVRTADGSDEGFGCLISDETKDSCVAQGNSSLERGMVREEAFIEDSGALRVSHPDRKLVNTSSILPCRGCICLSVIQARCIVSFA